MGNVMQNYPAIENFWAENHKQFEVPTDFRWLALPIAILVVWVVASLMFSFLGMVSGAAVFIMIKEFTPWLKPQLKDTSAGGLFYKKDGNVAWLLSTSLQSFDNLSGLDLLRAKKTATKINEAINERKKDLIDLENKGFDEARRAKQIKNADECILEITKIIEVLEGIANDNARIREEEKSAEMERKKNIQHQRNEIKEEIATLNLAKKSGLLDSEKYEKLKNNLMEQLNRIK